jgi:hypothetical protein
MSRENCGSLDSGAVKLGFPRSEIVAFLRWLSCLAVVGRDMGPHAEYLMTKSL